MPISRALKPNKNYRNLRSKEVDEEIRCYVKNGMRIGQAMSLALRNYRKINCKNIKKEII